MSHISTSSICLISQNEESGENTHKEKEKHRSGRFFCCHACTCLCMLETDTVKQAWNLITDQYSALLHRDQKTSDSGLWGGVGGVLMHLDLVHCGRCPQMLIQVLKSMFCALGDCQNSVAVYFWHFKKESQIKANVKWEREKTKQMWKGQVKAWLSICNAHINSPIIYSRWRTKRCAQSHLG